jgi:hypothetical protein
MTPQQNPVISPQNAPCKNKQWNSYIKTEKKKRQRDRETERQRDRETERQRDRERKSFNLTGSVVLCQKIAMRKVAATGGVRKLEMD